MGFLSKIFTWWNGATIGTMVWSARHGEQVGTDYMGNRYYRSKERERGDRPFAGR
ncbi:MAG: NADH:ubiquinone oxidoreductase subunit NDUFA12, partial [Tsuneonella sp.]